MNKISKWYNFVKKVLIGLIYCQNYNMIYLNVNQVFLLLIICDLLHRYKERIRISMKRDIDEYFLSNKLSGSPALILSYAGHEQCKPNHYFGPAVRAHYLLHFIKSGKGCFQSHGKKYNLGKNQMFLIKPGEITFYIADPEDPWEYVWIAFNGTDVVSILQDCGLLNEVPVSDYVPDEKLFDSIGDIIDQLRNKIENRYALLGNLYTIFGWLSRNRRDEITDSKNLYINQAVKFIQNNYSYDIKIDDIARYVQIDRTYLYRLFMDEFNLSPKQYLLQYRLKTALNFLNNSNNTVLEITYKCGFKDPSAFCKYFRKQFGFTPDKYRKIDGDAVLSYVDI